MILSCIHVKLKLRRLQGRGSRNVQEVKYMAPILGGGGRGDRAVLFLFLFLFWRSKKRLGQDSFPKVSVSGQRRQFMYTQNV